jgi:thiol-disulfide isomerase/thioredoxin
MTQKQIIIICVAVAAFFIAGGLYVEKVSPNTPTKATPAQIAGTLGDYGKAPDFTGGGTWINSQPLTIASLKGKVVLVDFWTFSCINCIRTLPYTTKWYNEYNQDGLVVIGVHTPEFAFEQNTDNVKNAVAQFGIKYPVVQDNVYGIWNAYKNEYWPAEYLINQQGEIVEEHFGEGNYTETEDNIRALLGLKGAASDAAPDLTGIQSPEMYFGEARLENIDPKQSPSFNNQNYTLNPTPALNNFSVGGTWKFSVPNAELESSTGQVSLKFHSANLYMVAASTNPVTLHITVDGKPQPDVTVQASKLYTLFSSTDYADHTAIITVTGSGFQAYTFTFG